VTVILLIRALFTRVFFVDPIGTVTSTQEIRGYITVTVI
jgi:hypothetical protein